MKAKLIFGLCLAAAITCAQDQAQPVTFRAAAQTLEKLLAALSEQTKLHLKAAPSIKGEVILVSVDKMPLKDLLTKLADVTAGTWSSEGDEWTLSINSQLARADRANEASERLATVKKAIKQMVDSLNPKKDAKPDDSVQLNPFGTVQTPAAKAIVKLLNLVDPRILADLESQGRVVFATSPTAMQKPLPSKATPILTELVREQNEVAKAKAANDAKNPPSEMQRKLLDFAKEFGFGADDQEVKAPAVKALLVAERQQFFPGVSLQIRLFDEKGNIVLTGTSMLMLPGKNMFGMDFQALVDPSKQPKPLPDSKEPEIELSELSKELEAVGTFTTQGVSEKPLSEALRARLIRPDEFDPLSFAQSDLILGIARLRHLDVVANLPDSMAQSFSFAATTAGKKTPTAVLAQLKSNPELKLTETTSAMELMPAHPTLSREGRLDRKALARFIAQAKDQEAPSLDSIAEYATKAPPPMETQVSLIYLMTFAPSAVSGGMSGVLDWNLLRFYGHLNADQKQGLLSGKRLAFALFSPDQLALVSKMVFGANPHLTVEREGSKPAEEGGLMDMIRSFMPGAGSDYRDEPTEVMPTGIPPNGWLEVDVKDDNFVVPQEMKGPGAAFGKMSMGTDELAMFNYFREDASWAMMSGFMPTFDKVKLGERKTLSFTFQLAPKVSYRKRLNDDHLDKNSKSISMKDLPAGFLDRIAKRTQKFKDNPLPFDPSMFGGAGGPPPR